MTTTAETATPAQHPDPISFHWIMTVQTNDGRQVTNDGKVGAVPGLHTRETTFQAVRDSMKGLVGTDNFTVLFFSLAPNAI